MQKCESTDNRHDPDFANPVSSIDRARTKIVAFAARYKVAITLVAVLIFVGGVYTGAREIELSKINPLPILINLALVNPVMLVLSAIGLQQMGRLAQRQIPFGLAFNATIYGRAAEFLPLPGVAIATGAALLKSGAQVKETAKVMAWSAVQTLSLAGLIGGVPIAGVYPWLGWSLLGGSAVAFLASSHWIVRTVSGRHFGAIIMIKLASLGLSIVRAALSFVAIGASIPLVKVTVFCINGTLTSMIGIVPGGIGLGELIAAGLAVTVAITPTVAFLAIAVNRLTVMVLTGILAGIFWNRWNV